MGDSRKHLSGYLKTDQAEILYKYQMYDQSKLSKSLKTWSPKPFPDQRDNFIFAWGFENEKKPF